MVVSENFKKFKSFLCKAGISLMLVFALLVGSVPGSVHVLHAEATPTAKASFITWLMSYFGINVYSDGQQIADELYTAVKFAYETYLASQQPSSQVQFDDLFDGITFTPSQPNALRLSGWVFNALKGFSNWMNASNTVDEVGDFIGYPIGDYTTSVPGSYFVLTNTFYESEGVSYKFGIITSNASSECRVICVHDGRYYFYVISNNSFKGKISTVSKNSSINNSTQSNSTSYTYTGINYQYISNNQSSNFFTDYPNVDIPIVEKLSGLSTLNTAIEYTFGSYIQDGEGVLYDVYALPDQAVLDDLIGAVDPESEVQIDLDGSDIAIGTLATLEDLISYVEDLVGSYVIDNSYPETIGKVIAQSVAIDDELVDIAFPDALTWEVPELINTPQIIPLITPDCPDLSACIVAGIQDVGQSLGNVIESNSNVSNYVSVILFMGIALTILGGI